jgi:spermidine/putrescine transport system substrate-binding protein
VTDKVVRWANWTAYLDYDEETKKYPTLERFMAETGIRAEYTEDIEDNDAYFNKIAPQLRAGQDIGRDIFTFTDWMANRIIRDQLCQPLELITMPNAPNLLPALQNVSFDPGRNFSLTWQSGFAGIGYDKSKVSKEIKTLDDLWTDELKGKIVVLSEFRDTVGIIMQSQGVDITSEFGKAEFEAAWPRSRSAWTRATSAGSRATPTWRTSSRATPSPASSGAVTCSSCAPRPRTRTGSSSSRSRAARSGATT